jgi:3-dehydroshikimate dehydratase
MKVSCCTTGFREFPLGQTLAILEGMGFEYVEATTDGRAHLYPYLFEGRDWAELDALLANYKLKLVAMMGGWSDFAVEDRELEAQYNSLRRQLELCRHLGIGVLRVFASHLPREAFDGERLRRMIRNIRRFAPEAEASGICLVVENHYGITATAEDMLRILEGVDSPAVRANFDPANFVPMGEDPVRACRLLLPYIGHIHLKDAIYTGQGRFNGYEYCELGCGCIDYEQILGILQEGGYRGFLSVEYERREDIVRGTEASYRRLKELLAQLGGRQGPVP